MTVCFFNCGIYGKKKSRVDILDIFAIHVNIAPGIELGDKRHAVPYCAYVPPNQKLCNNPEKKKDVCDGGCVIIV